MCTTEQKSLQKEPIHNDEHSNEIYSGGKGIWTEGIGDGRSGITKDGLSLDTRTELL